MMGTKWPGAEHAQQNSRAKSKEARLYVCQSSGPAQRRERSPTPECQAEAEMGSRPKRPLCCPV